MKLIKKYPNSILSQKDLRRVSSHLLKGDIPLERSPVNRFGITAKDIIPGVFCQECTPISVIQRIYGGWKCPRCALISLNAHLPALEDYALTINPFIGIKEVQEFLQLKNPYIARRVIQSLDPEFICNTKGRKYKIPIF
jgi:hypothetical protein